MATITASVAGGDWNTTAAWVGGLIPSASDDVLLTATSGSISLPASYTALCRSLDCTGYAATLTFASTTSVLQVGDGFGGAFKLVAAMTLALTGVGTINLVSTSSNLGTGWAVTTAGKVMPNLTLNGAGGKWVQQDALTATGATVTLTAGTWDTGSFAVTCGTLLSNNTNTRTLTLGSSSVTVTAGSTNCLLFNGIGTSMTVTANTATVTMTGANPAPNVSASAGSGNMNGASLVLTPTTSASMINFSTWANVTFNGPANKLCALYMNGSGFTTPGAFTVNGNSVTNRVLVASNVVGSARTITAATVSVSNADFQDITGAGAASWDLSAVTGGSGNCGGNSMKALGSAAFTTAVAQTHTASAGGNWSDVTKWTSRVPLPQDTVTVNAATTGTLTMDMPRLGSNVNFTGFAGTLAYATPVTGYGDWTFSSAMTLSGAQVLYLQGRGTHTLTNAGKTHPSSLNMAAPGGSYTLADALTLGGTGTWQWANGTFNSNNFAITVPRTDWVGSLLTRAMNLGTSTISITGVSSTFHNAVATGLTLSAASTTIVLTAVTAVSRTFAGGSQVYGTLTYTVAGSTGALVITGANTFATLNFSDVTNARTLTFPSSTVTTVTTFNVNGTAGKLMTVNSSTSGTAATLTKGDANPTISGYLSIQDIAATPANTWYADTTSTNVSGNSGWLFTKMPVGAQRQAVWAVKQTVAASRQTVWNTRATATASRQTVWAVRTNVGDQRATTWNSRAAVAANRQTTWAVHAALGVTRQTVWHVTANIAAARSTTWNTAAAVGESRATVWDVRAAVAASRALTWVVRTPVAAQGTLAWRVTAAVTASRQLGWPVKAHAAAQRDVTWDTRATVAASRTTAWRVRANVPVSRSLAWRIRTSVAVTETLRWQVAQTIGAQRVATWHVKATLGAQRGLQWRTRYGPSRDITLAGAPPTPAWAGTAPTDRWKATTSTVPAWTGAP